MIGMTYLIQPEQFTLITKAFVAFETALLLLACLLLRLLDKKS